MITFAIVPVKELDKAKSRLSEHLKPEIRKGLLLAMLGDVLGALKFLPTIVISPKDMMSYLKDSGTFFLLQEGSRDLDTAVKQANAFAVEKGAGATLFVPADMPLITKKEIDDVLRIGTKHKVVITQARDGGTGILYRRPPDVMESRFSNHSFRDHRTESEKRGLNMYVHESFPLSLDIDTVDDVSHFMEHGKGTKTYEYLRKAGVR